MRRRPLALYGLVIACLLAGAWLDRQTVHAQAVTPAPWLSIAGPFSFCYTYPGMLGCAPAEDKTGDAFVRGFKVDVDRARADCLRWGAVGAVPAAQLSLDAACTGGVRLVGGIYWFEAPLIGTPNPPSSPTATATSASIPPSPSATSTPGATPASGTPTPPAQATRTPTPTPAPFGTPIIIPYQPRPWAGQFSINGMCNQGMEEAYIYNIKRDDQGKLIAFDKIICTSRDEFAKTQGFDAIATLDARVPITTGWTFLNTPTPTPAGMGR